MNQPTVVSLTPAVFHLPEAVNQVSRTYGKAPIVPRGPAFAPLLAKAIGYTHSDQSVSSLFD